MKTVHFRNASPQSNHHILLNDIILWLSDMCLNDQYFYIIFMSNQ